MLALIEKTDSFGCVSYFTIVGMSESDCFDQLVELNSHAYYCETGNNFKIMGYRVDNGWITVDGKPLNKNFIKTLK